MNLQQLQGLTRDQAVDMCEKKKDWTVAEVKHMLSGMKLTLNTVNVDEIKIGDVIRPNGLGHPSIIFSITGTNVFSIILTTEKSCPAILRACSSRKYSTSFFTYTVAVHILSEVKGMILDIYDNPKELKEIKHLVKKFYRGL